MNKILKGTLLSFVSVVLLSLCINVNALTISEDYTLESDLNDYIYVTGDKTVTINLNGHNITNSDEAIYVYNGAKVTLKGNGIVKSTAGNGVAVYNGSTFTMESGTIQSQEFGVLVMKNSTFTMNGGTITTVDNCGAGGNGSDNDNYKNYTININGGTINGNITSAGYVSCGIYHPNKGTVNMTGGVINSSNGAGIVQRAGALNITGGVINAKGSTTGKVGDSRVVVSASAVVVDKEAAYPEMGTLATTISKDAELNGDSQAIETIGDDVVVKLLGGVYSDKPDDGTLETGYGAYEVIEGDNQGKFVVVETDSLTDKVLAPTVLDSVADDVQNLVAEAMEDGFEVAGYYDVNCAKVTEDGDVVAFVEEIDNAVKVTLAIPSDLPEVTDGFTREFQIVRVHDGEAEALDTTDNGNGTVSAMSDKFSTYAVTYKDTQSQNRETSVTSKDNPATGDSLLLIVLFMMIGLVGSYITSKKLANR